MFLIFNQIKKHFQKKLSRYEFFTALLRAFYILQSSHVKKNMFLPILLVV